MGRVFGITSIAFGCLTTVAAIVSAVTLFLPSDLNVHGNPLYLLGLLLLPFVLGIIALLSILFGLRQLKGS